MGKHTPLDPERVAWVQSLMARVLMPHTRSALICKQFNVGYRQAREYMKAARDEIRRAREQSLPERAQEIGHALQSLYERAATAEDYRSAIMALRELAELDGAKEPQRIELSGGVALEADPERARARLAELRVLQAKAGKP